MQAISAAFGDKMKVIWYNWVLIQALVFCYTICTFAAAADSNKSASFGFLVIWSMLITLAYSAGGTMVLRRVDYRTHLAVGFLIGVGAMQTNLMLCVAVMSGGQVPKFASTTATETFAAMLFIAYATFTTFIYLWKDILLPSTGDSAPESGVPPTAYGGNFDGGNYGGGGVQGGGGQGGVIGDSHAGGAGFSDAPQQAGSTAL